MLRAVRLLALLALLGGTGVQSQSAQPVACPAGGKLASCAEVVVSSPSSGGIARAVDACAAVFGASARAPAVNTRLDQLCTIKVRQLYCQWAQNRLGVYSLTPGKTSVREQFSTPPRPLPPLFSLHTI
jgi:hypothetical protein